MLNIGFSELLLFGIIALVVLGPDKLPTAVRTAGRWYARLRFMLSNLQQDIEKELQLSELRDHMQQELARIKLIEAHMQVQLNQMSGEIAELNHTSTNHTPSSSIDSKPVDSTNAQLVAAEALAAHAITANTIKTKPFISQRAKITYLPIEPQLSSTTNVPYIAPHCLKQNNWRKNRPPQSIHDYPRPIMRLQVETA